MADTRIILVYNADTGLAAVVRDWLHKMLRPASYPCRLCALTYGPFTMRRAWAQTLAALPHPHVALHRDEWQATHPDNNTPLPAILLQRGTSHATLVTANDFEALETLAELQALLADRLAGSTNASILPVNEQGGSSP